jgi:hypothetical protein
MDAMRRAMQRAEKCVALREAGKARQTEAAEKKALHWLRRAMQIESLHVIARRDPA